MDRSKAGQPDWGPETSSHVYDGVLIRSAAGHVSQLSSLLHMELFDIRLQTL